MKIKKSSLKPNLININERDTNINFLERIKVNYILYELYDYRGNLEELLGKTEKTEAYRRLKNKILDILPKDYQN